ncbi:MAG: agmatine deiminase family protein [Candidatus Omnitrophota bacterium]
MDSKILSQTPQQLGYFMPAEWERHEATWIAWPHNHLDWPGKFAPIPWVYGEIARYLSLGEIVRIIVPSKQYEARARNIMTRIGADSAKIEFFTFPTNRSWTRDYGPLFLKRKNGKSRLAIARFRFNAWAKYRNWRKDDKISEWAAQSLGLPLIPVQCQGRDVVLEGGAIDVNGQGTLLATEECLLDRETQARNPYLTREELESVLRSDLGVSNILWLGGGIAGDDTHGHIDDLCRFVSPTTVVLCEEKNPKDVNYKPLQENRERLQEMRLEDRSKIEAVPLPMPHPLYFEGTRLPASYANFYIANAAVLVPTFNDPNDRIALGILGELFADRPAIGIHAVDLVWGFGTIHCLTQQQPSAK